MILYHGSENVISNPECPKGNPHNDYGLAFYTTPSYHLAAEWAVDRKLNGYVNQYGLEMDKVKVLDLTSEKYDILHWIAILLKNRVFDTSSEIMKHGKEYLEQHYSVPYPDYDVICGWRADDSYFSFARAFLNNSLSVERLSEAIRFGNLGIQYALMSETAFANLKYMESHLVQSAIYYPLKTGRDEAARTDYMRLQKADNTLNETYLIDLIRKGS